jgi:methylmalonyl-CoA epimerase
MQPNASLPPPEFPRTEGVDHIAIAVPNLEAAIQQYSQMLGLRVAHRETIEEQGVREALLAIGTLYIQLLEPLSAESAVGKFLAKRGPGLHHIGYRVKDVAAAIAECKKNGARMIDESPRRGSRGTTIAFVHPSSMGGVLVELVQENQHQ